DGYGHSQKGNGASSTETTPRGVEAWVRRPWRSNRGRELFPKRFPSWNPRADKSKNLNVITEHPRQALLSIEQSPICAPTDMDDRDQTCSEQPRLRLASAHIVQGRIAWIGNVSASDNSAPEHRELRSAGRD